MASCTGNQEQPRENVVGGCTKWSLVDRRLRGGRRAGLGFQGKAIRRDRRTLARMKNSPSRRQYLRSRSLPELMRLCASKDFSSVSICRPNQGGQICQYYHSEVLPGRKRRARRSDRDVAFDHRLCQQAPDQGGIQAKPNASRQILSRNWMCCWQEVPTGVPTGVPTCLDCSSRSRHN